MSSRLAVQGIHLAVPGTLHQSYNRLKPLRWACALRRDYHYRKTVRESWGEEVVQNTKPVKRLPAAPTLPYGFPLVERGVRRTHTNVSQRNLDF